MAAANPYFVGLTVEEFAIADGRTLASARGYLSSHGYTTKARLIVPRPTAQDVEQEIADRLAAAPPSAPCHRCGVRVGCEHRGMRA